MEMLNFEGYAQGCTQNGLQFFWRFAAPLFGGAVALGYMRYELCQITISYYIANLEVINYMISPRVAQTIPHPESGIPHL